MRGMLAAGLIGLALGGTPTRADEVKVLTTGAFKQALLALIPAFEARTGHRVAVENDTAGGVARRIREGAAFDLVVLTPGGIDDLVKAGTVAPESRTDLARVGVGVAARAGAPRPDIGTVEAFRQELLGARSVAYIDPRSGGSSGIYVDGLVERLGIAEAVRAKAVLVPGGYAAERVASGEAELAVQQISEILPVAGVELVGPLPAEIQTVTTYTAALNAAAQPGPARALLDALSGPDAAAVLAQKGMTPPVR